MNISRHIGLLSVGVLAGLVVLVSFLLTRAPDPELDTEPVVVNVVPSTAAQFVPDQPAPPPPAPVVPYDDDWDDDGNWDDDGGRDDDGDWDDDNQGSDNQGDDNQGDDAWGDDDWDDDDD